MQALTVRANWVEIPNPIKRAFICFFFSVLLLTIAITTKSLAQEPDTIFTAGPSGSISSRNVVFFWTGKVSDMSTSSTTIKGFYYKLDNNPWSWTQDRFIAFYNLPEGDHQFLVRAVDSENRSDPSPASVNFTVTRSLLVEPDEALVRFNISPDFQGDLNNKILSTALKQELRIRGLAISDFAKVTGGNGIWFIRDEDKLYLLKSEDQTINVYGPLNDESSYATTLEVNRSISCQSRNALTSIDKDWFKVDLLDTRWSYVRQVAILFNRIDARGSTLLKLYRSPLLGEGKEIARFVVRDRGFFVTGISQGIYYLQVEPSESEVPTTSYDLTVMVSSIPPEITWDKEPNNESAEPTEASTTFLSDITPWMEIVGTKQSESDNKDWYRIHVSTNDRRRISLDMTRPQTGLSKVRLYSSTLKLIGEFVVSPESGPQWKLDLAVILGDYFLEVDLTNYNPGTLEPWSRPYFLTLRLSKLPKDEVWELEPNDLPQFADQVRIGKRVKCSRGNPDDIDWFRLSVQGDGILNLSASRLLLNGTIGISLMDAVGQLISQFSVRSGTRATATNYEVTKGDYLLKVEFNDFVGDYWLTALFVTSVEHDVPRDKILTTGDKIGVKLVWEKGNYAEFNILDGNRLINSAPIVMYDDGKHDDGLAGDGVYAGHYVITNKDNSSDAVVIVTIRDDLGNKADITAKGNPIVIDTTPPVINWVRHNATGPLPVGNELSVTIAGEPGNQGSFSILSKDNKVWLDNVVAYDDGKHDDGKANDGIYAASYIVKPEDYVSEAIVVGYLRDNAGNTASLRSEVKVDIVGERPLIRSVIHDGRLTLGKGHLLTVELIGDAECFAEFDIEGLITNVPMYDDGKHNDGERGDGRYTGTYVVKEGDEVTSAIVKVRLTNKKGLVSEKSALLTVSLDAVPPVSVIGVQCEDRPNDQGKFITVKWEPSKDIDFAGYKVYLSKDVPFPNGISLSQWQGTILESFTISNRNETKLDVDVSKYQELDSKFYVAVTAFDFMKNESYLDINGGSTGGPARAEDNLSPTPVKIVKAEDRPKDLGGAIILSWSETNKDEDFARYNIYMHTNQITSLRGLKPIDSVEDRLVNELVIYVDSDDADYYFAVTAVDLSGNESELDRAGGSVSGPVRSKPNITVQPETRVTLISGPIGLIQHNHVAFRWNRFTETVQKGFYVRMDNQSWTWTTDVSAVFYNVPEGEHTFSIRTVDNVVVERAFVVRSVFTLEHEPNDGRDNASRIRPGVVMKGMNSNSDDWFKIHVPSEAGPQVMDLMLSYRGSSISVAIYSETKEIARSSSTNGAPLHLSAGILPGEDYYVNIPAGDAQYNMVLMLNKLPRGYALDSEPNDSPNAPNILIVDDRIEISGEVDPSSFEDWFKLHISPKSMLPNSNLVLSVRPYLRSSLIRIYSSPQISAQIGEISGVGRDPTDLPYFSGLVKTGSDYYIQVLNTSNKDRYQLLVSLSKPPEIEVYEVEPNDTPLLANDLQFGAAKYGTSWNGDNDIDYYRISVSKAGVLNIQFSRPSGAGSTKIELYNAGLQLIKVLQASIANSQSNSDSVDISPGLYYIKVSPRGEFPSAEYSLLATFINSINVKFLTNKGEEVGQRPMKVGDLISAEVIWAEDGEVSFSIDNPVTGEPQRVVSLSKKGNVYAGTYSISEGDSISGFHISFTLYDGKNTVRVRLDRFRIGIVDTLPPLIVDVSHDGFIPLASGKKLTVKMIAEPRCRAYFDIGDLKTGLDMFNMPLDLMDPPLMILNWDWRIDPDGQIRVFGNVKNVTNLTINLVKIKATFYDSERKEVGTRSSYTTPTNIAPNGVASFMILYTYTNKEEKVKIKLLYGSDEKTVVEIGDDEGTYVGSYVVQDDDNITEAPVICHIVDQAGNVSSLRAQSGVTFDNIPPTITSLAHNADRTLVEGDVLNVKMVGEPNNEASFDIGSFRTGIKMTYEGNNVYVGTYRVRPGDKVIGGQIVGHLVDPAGNKTDYVSPRLVTIDTSAPKLTRVSHNYLGRPFIEGEVLKVTVVTDPGAFVTFDIENFVSNIVMYDDGKHEDGEPGDGIYAGTYAIKKGDNVESVRIKVIVRSPNGKVAEQFGIDTISIDTIPPPPVDGVIAVDRPNDEGGYVLLSWNKSTARDTVQYRIYRSEQYITSTLRTDLIKIIDDVNVSKVEIKLPEVGPVGQKYYFAVTAVDQATNESALSKDSVAGPIAGIDNLPPPPVKKVLGYDRDFDNGKTVVITWTEPSPSIDFHHYNIYMSKSLDELRSGKGLIVNNSISDRNVRIAIVNTPDDDTEFFFAVTAVDTSNNESEIVDDSIVGPLRSKDNIGPVPQTYVRIESGPVGEIYCNDVTFSWSRWSSSGERISGYYYRLNKGNWTWTNENSRTFYDLGDGEYTFYVKADLGNADDPIPAARTFKVKRTSILESEPNNAPDKCNWVSADMTFVGTCEDRDDWYGIHVGTSGLLTLHLENVKDNILAKLYSSSQLARGSAIADVRVQGPGKAKITVGVSTGDYFLSVSPEGEVSNGRYEFSFSISTLGQDFQWDTETNDTANNGQLIGEWRVTRSELHDVQVSGLGNNAGDIDWYKFKVSDVDPNTSTFVNLDFLRPGSPSQTILSVYSYPPEVESSKITSVTYTHGMTRKLKIPIKAGEYYIKIDSSQDNSIYSFRIWISTGQEFWEVEPNNSHQFANSIPIGRPIVGTSLDPDVDLDWFKVRLTKRSMVVVSFYRPYGAGTTEITITNLNLSPIRKASAGVLVGGRATIAENLDIGDYYISVDPVDEADFSAEYRLVVSIMELEYWIIDDGIKYTASSIKNPISKGDMVKIQLSWEPNSVISFDVGSIRRKLPMYDDGAHDDLSAGDGIYTGVYEVQSGENGENVKIEFFAIMPPGSRSADTWSSEFPLLDPKTNQTVTINIDTTPPIIFSTEHDMPLNPLSAGKVLKVKMNAERGASKSSFDIVYSDGKIFKSDIAMVENPDGVYSGQYLVENGDNIVGGLIVFRLKDLAGNETSQTNPKPIYFDTTKPIIRNVSHNAKRTLVEGDILIVSVETDTPGGIASFSVGDSIKDVYMNDDGIGVDSVAGDGIYTGRYVVKKGDNLTDGIVSVVVSDKAGNVSTSVSYDPITIDTTPPKILSLTHNATRLLTEGAKLVVTLKGDAGNNAFFDIEGFKTGLPMYDDGTRGDEKPSDGVYVGVYTVQKGDYVRDARITGYLINKNGNKTVHSIFERVNIDAVPPPPVVQVKAFDHPNDQGFYIKLTWSYEPSDEREFDHYNIYREASPIISTRGLTPIFDDGRLGLNISSTKSAVISVPSNNIDYYIAVTVVDDAGNESPIDRSETGSVFGPVRAIDNIPPDPVTVVTASDMPNDNGKRILVSWTGLSKEPDFGRYNIYLAQDPIISLEGLKPAITATRREIIMSEQGPGIERPSVILTVDKDNVDYYVAVTAVDINNNESALDPEGKSVAGPVRAKDNLPPKPVFVVDAYDTPNDNGGFINVAWIDSTDEEIARYNIYISKQIIDEINIKRIPLYISVEYRELLFETSDLGRLAVYRLAVPDGFFYIAVTAVDRGGNESGLSKDGNSVTRPVQAVTNVVKEDTISLIFSDFEQRTYIELPAGAIRGGGVVNLTLPDAVTLQKVEEANKFLERSHIDPKLEPLLSSTVIQIKGDKIRKPAVIHMAYPDITELQNYEGGQEDEKNFRIFKLNELSKTPRWELVTGDQKVDIIGNTIHAQIDSLGVFRIARLKLPENLSRVIVYPNPFIRSQSLSGYITFKNLKENVTINIYNLNGERINTLEKRGGGDELRWNVLTKDGSELASGTYIFTIQSETETFIGKLFIMK